MYHRVCPISQRTVTRRRFFFPPSHVREKRKKRSARMYVNIIYTVTTAYVIRTACCHVKNDARDTRSGGGVLEIPLTRCSRSRRGRKTGVGIARKTYVAMLLNLSWWRRRQRLLQHSAAAQG